MAQDKRVLIELVNMLAGTLQGIGQQRQQQGAQRQQFGMQQQQMQMQESRFNQEMAMEKKKLDAEIERNKNYSDFIDAQTKQIETGVALEEKTTALNEAIAAKTGELSTQGIPTMPQTAFEKYPDIAKAAIPGDVRKSRPVTQEQLAPELMKAFAGNPAAQAQVMKSFGGGNLFKSEADILQVAQSIASLGTAGLPWENIQELVPNIDANLKPIWEFSNMMRELGVQITDTQLQQLLASIGYTEAQTQRILNPVFAPRAAPAAPATDVIDQILKGDMSKISDEELAKLLGETK